MFETSLAVFIFCLLLAFLEVQIEGPHGWAIGLPTWRPQEHSFLARVYKKIMHKKELTGYHIGMFVLILFVLHGFYFFRTGFEFSTAFELQIVGMFFLITVVWDFLWFVINPHFGWRSFKPARVAWHKQWLGPWPIDYYWGICLYILLFTWSYGPNWQIGFWQAFALLAYMVLWTVVVVLVRNSIDILKK